MPGDDADAWEDHAKTVKELGETEPHADLECFDCGVEIHAPGGVCRNCEQIRKWGEEIVDHGFFGKHPRVWVDQPGVCCKYGRKCFCVCISSTLCPIHGQTCRGTHD